jgi:hypothetical protein
MTTRGACFYIYVRLNHLIIQNSKNCMSERKMIMLKTGAKIRIRDRTGTIIYVNRLIKCYQVMYNDKRGELVSFEDVKEKTVN